MINDMTEHDVNAIAERVEEAILARISRWLLIYALPAVVANGMIITGIIWWAAVTDTRVDEHERTLIDRSVAVSRLAVLEKQVEVNGQFMNQIMQEIRGALRTIEDRQFQDRRSNGRQRNGGAQ